MNTKMKQDFCNWYNAKFECCLCDGFVLTPEELDIHLNCDEYIIGAWDVWQALSKSNTTKDWVINVSMDTSELEDKVDSMIDALQNLKAVL